MIEKASKYPRTPYAPFSPSARPDLPYADLHNFLNVPLVITEKLDGSNVLLHAGQAYPRSTDSKGPHPWLAMVRKHHAWKTQPHLDTIFYGEDIFGVHSIRYSPVPEDQTFYLFAVQQGAHWLSWDQVTQWSDDLGTPTVPVLLAQTFRTAEELTDTALKLMQEPSTLGSQAEGIVIRHRQSFHRDLFLQRVCKAVRPNHVQPDSQHWTHNWQACTILPAH